MLDINRDNDWEESPPNRLELQQKLKKLREKLIIGFEIATDDAGKIQPVLTIKQLKEKTRSIHLLDLVVGNILQTIALEGACILINESLTKLMVVWPNQHIDLLQSFLKEFHIHRYDP